MRLICARKLRTVSPSKGERNRGDPFEGDRREREGEEEEEANNQGGRKWRRESARIKW